ncbi:MAG: helix-turn-helix domain-containing protein [bacterium]
MENYLLKTIQNIVDYIEDNIKKDISLDDLANYSNFSKYHLHRIFRSITNTRLIDYVRGRKLSNSVHFLINSNLNIIDIAQEFGFKYEQSYIRAFKREFNITPARYRRNQTQLSLTNILDTNLIKSIDNGIILNPEIIFKPSFHIIGIENRINHQENVEKYTAAKSARSFYLNYQKKIKNALKPEKFIGLSRYQKLSDPESVYITALEVTSLNDIPDDLIGLTLAANTYAVFKYIGIHNADEITFNTISSIFFNMLDWLEQNSIYQRIPGFHFERIDADNNNDNYTELELFLPISEANHEINHTT